MHPTCPSAQHLRGFIPVSEVLIPVFKRHFLFLYVCLWVHAPFVRMLTEARQCIGFPGAGLGGWEVCEHLTCMDAGRQTWIHVCFV